MNQALDKVRVLDLTQWEAGTSCTQMLAWLGADVIKVERPGSGEAGRRSSADRADTDSMYFQMLNANKRSITLDLKNEASRDLVRRLIEQCDVFIENFAPGVIERLGWSWDVVREINPRIIYAQIKGFAPDGPLGDLLAFDMTAQAAGGSVSVTGEENGPPLRPGITVGDTGTGLHCALGIVSALYQRQSTGRGQRIEVTMQECLINFGRITYAAQFMLGKATPRNGNQSVLAASSPSGIYACAGGGPNDYCFIYTSRQGNEHWQRLLGAIGRKDLANDPRFSSPELRYEHREEIDALMSRWCLQHDKFTVMKLLGTAGVPASAVYDTQELSSDPHLRKRGMFVTVEHPTRGEYLTPGCPIRMSDSAVEVKASPLLGAHNEEIYGALLGLAPGDLAALRKQNLI
jgi:formyl-CoA transferase